jgi:hypothetical protein
VGKTDEYSSHSYISLISDKQAQWIPVRLRCETLIDEYFLPNYFSPISKLNGFYEAGPGYINIPLLNPLHLTGGTSFL